MTVFPRGDQRASSEATDSRPGHHKNRTFKFGFFFFHRIYRFIRATALSLPSHIVVSRASKACFWNSLFCGVSRRKNSHLGYFYSLTAVTQVRFPSGFSFYPSRGLGMASRASVHRVDKGVWYRRRCISCGPQWVADSIHAFGVIWMRKSNNNWKN